MRPLTGGTSWPWKRGVAKRWEWCRVYHQGTYSPTGTAARRFGPIGRFDPHRPDAAGERQIDPDGRSVLYVGANLATSLAEVFGELQHAALCPRWRVAILAPIKPLPLLELHAQGSAMALGALPSLGSGPEPRALTQEWARAIYEDQPAPVHVTGVRYTSGYNAGEALAVWDSDGKVETVLDRTGRPADVALADARMLPRVKAAATSRRITVAVIDPTACALCKEHP